MTMPHLPDPRLSFWKLDGKTPIPAKDFPDFATSMASEEGRRVARTEEDGWLVSTIFLGCDRRGLDGPPVLFETMVFGLTADDHGDRQRRYCTWEEAERGHELAVEWARSVVALAKEKADAAIAGAVTAKE